MDKKFDIITVGDSTIDTFIKIHDAQVKCDINHEDCKIIIPYGEKIPVDAIGHGVAGNAANVAVACSKLGLKTAIYTNVGDDNPGMKIKKSLEESGISADYIKVNEGKESNLSVILTFQGERTAFVYHQSWNYQLPPLEDSSWLYFTSVAESFTNSNLVEEICHYIDKTGAKLAFSPGTLQIKADIKMYPRLLERVKLLILNLEEAKKVLGIDLVQKIEVKDLLAKLLLLGPKIAVITDGAEGSYATDGQKNFKAPVFPVEVVEKTGAGDSYAGALISAFLFGKTLEEAMIWGSQNSAATIKKLGPQNGLLTRDEIERNIRAVPEMVATIF